MNHTKDIPVDVELADIKRCRVADRWAGFYGAALIFRCEAGVSCGWFGRVDEANTFYTPTGIGGNFLGVSVESGFVPVQRCPECGAGIEPVVGS